MGSPVVADDFQSAIVTPTGSVCDRLKAFFSVATKLSTFWQWAFDAAGNATDNFKELFRSIGVPTGGLLFWPTQSIPNGWLLANGQEVSRTQYPTLFALYGTTFGLATNASNFKLPDMRGLVPVGANGGSFPFGQATGDETITLTLAQIPGHSHGMPLDVNAIRTDLAPGSGSNNDDSISGGGFMGKATFTEDGSDGAHSNVQPSFPGYWLVKT